MYPNAENTTTLINKTIPHPCAVSRLPSGENRLIIITGTAITRNIGPKNCAAPNIKGPIKTSN